MAGEPVTFQVEQVDGTPVDSFTDPVSARWMHAGRGEGPGSGQITMHRDHPDFGDLDYGLVVTVDVAGVDRHTFVLESRQTVRAQPGEDAGVLARWEGRGLLAAMGDVGLGGAVVYPEGGVGGLEADPRMFGWMDCGCFDHAGFGFAAPAAMNHRQDDPDPPWTAAAPESWPDGQARRLWCTAPTVVSSGADEVQSIALGDSIDSGTFTLTFRGATTATIGTPWSAAQVASALEALSTITDVTVVGSGLDSDPYLVTFLDPGGQNVPLISVDHSSLNHPPQTGTVTVVQEGAAATYATAKGCCYFHHEFVTATDQTLILFVNLAKTGEVWIDGLQIYRQDSAAAAKRTQTVTIDLPAGDHCLNAKVCQGSSSGLAWFMFTLAQATENGDGTFSLGAVAARSTAATLAFSTSVNAPEPGVTVGELVICLDDEARARGALSWLTEGFDGTDDSGAVGWVSDYTWAFSVGTPYSQIVAQVEQLAGVLAELGPSRVLEIWQDEAGSSGATLAEGTSIVESTYTTQGPAGNAALVASSQAWDEFVDAASVAAYGRLEFATVLGVQPSIADLETFANQILNRSIDPTETATVVAGPDAGGPQPYVDVEPGETIVAPDEDGAGATWRVLALGAEPNDAGVYVRWTFLLRKVGPSGS